MDEEYPGRLPAIVIMCTDFKEKIKEHRYKGGRKIHPKFRNEAV